MGFLNSNQMNLLTLRLLQPCLQLAIPRRMQAPCVPGYILQATGAGRWLLGHSRGSGMVCYSKGL